MSAPASATESVSHRQIDHDVVIIGAGFAGMYQLHRLRGLGLNCRVFETGSGIGGTWYWNRYPGARCDVESIHYSYSFDKDLEQEWTWPERYSAQPDILEYAEHVADRFDLRRDITFNTRVTALDYDDHANRWTVTTDTGEQVTAQFVITAVGCLSTSQTPHFEGVETFTGQTYHTGHWPHEPVDLSGKRVGVIGTGSSGIQTITAIAPIVGDLTVFQRTANFSVPSRNRPLTPSEIAEVKDHYPQIRDLNRQSKIGFITKGTTGKPTTEFSELEIEKILQQRWDEGGQLTGAFTDLLVSAEANEIAAEFARSRIRDLVNDPETADLLCPTTHPIGTKRLCVDTGYFQVYNRDNVHLIDINAAPIERIAPQGIVAGGELHELDVIIFATGFDAMTGPLNGIAITAGGQSLKEKWHAGPRTYLGLMSHGFPNLFMITGPGSPSVLTNMIISIEQHVDAIADAIVHIRERDLARIEPMLQAEDEWVDSVNEAAAGSLMVRANSWYMGANVPGKPRIFMPYIGGAGAYRQTCDQVVADGYAGFAMS